MSQWELLSARKFCPDSVPPRYVESNFWERLERVLHSMQSRNILLTGQFDGEQLHGRKLLPHFVRISNSLS